MAAFRGKQFREMFPALVFAPDVQQKATTHDFGLLVAEIVRFFQSGVAPVAMDETVEMFAFMEAADVSAKNGGTQVKIADVLQRAGKD